MGSISARKLNQVIDNLEFILGIELLTSCQAIEFRRPLRSSVLLEAAHDFVRRSVSFAKEDRVFADDINKIKTMVSDFSFVGHVNEVASANNINLP
jgi:histidine ammonia-lyase